METTQVIQKHQPSISTASLNTTSASSTSKIIFPQLKKIYQSLPRQKTTFQQKLNSIYLKAYQQQERDVINQLIQIWDQSTDLQILMYDEFANNLAFYNYYRNVEILSARVYHLVVKFFTDIRVRTIKEVQGKSLEEFRKILEVNELYFSYNRHFWDKKYLQNSGVDYSQYNFKTHQQPKVIYQNKFILSIHDWIKDSQIDLLKVLHKFLLNTCFISLEKSNLPVQNEFINTLERLTREQQRKKYIDNLRLQQYQNLKRLSNQNYQYQGQKQEIIQKIHKILPNYEFYAGLKVQGKYNLEELHDKFQSSTFLDDKKDLLFLQMFPNHYGYTVKSKAVPLNYVQKQFIIQDQSVCFNILYSTVFYLDYLGLAINCKDFSLSIKDIVKLQKAILVNTYNHSKIMRLISSLSIVGFRAVALNLINLLDQQTKEGRPLNKQRLTFENSWDVYGIFNKMTRKTAKTMCFLETQDFPKTNSLIDYLQQNNLQINL